MIQHDFDLTFEQGPPALDGAGLPTLQVVECPFCSTEVDAGERFCELGRIAICPACGRYLQVLGES